MSRLEEILQKYEDKNEMHFFQIVKETIIYPAVKEYVKECIKASLEKAKKDLYNYWIFFEEGKTNSPEFTIKVEDPAKVYNTAYEAYGPQVEDLFYSCVSHEESITNPDNIIIL